MPSPPRVMVPPPILDESGIPVLGIDNDASFNFESNGFANAGFLQTVTYGDFMTGNNMLDWKYEQRRRAQRILPFLFLGPVSAARDRDYLQREGITMVLAVRNTMSAQARLLGTKAAAELGIENKTVDVASNQALIAAFPTAIEYINSHLSVMYRLEESKTPATQDGDVRSTPGKVLVFCESGNERSAGLVVAYIMAMYSMDVIKAIQIVQAQRFCVSFDDPMKTLLQSYDAILGAKRDVLVSMHRARVGLEAGTAAVIMKKMSKRNLDEAYDDDMDMDGMSEHMDRGRFEKREGFAPFRDGVS